MRIGQDVMVRGELAKVVRLGRRRQGGSWVRLIWIRFESGQVRPALADTVSQRPELLAA